VTLFVWRPIYGCIEIGDERTVRKESLKRFREIVEGRRWL